MPASDSLLAEIVRTVPCVLYQVRRDLDGGISFAYVSDGVRAFGLEPQALLKDARGLARLMPAADLSRVGAAALEAARRGTAWRTEYRLLTREDGEPLWLDAHEHPVRSDPLGTLFSGYVVDITDRKRLEEQVRLSEQKFRTFVEGVNDLIYTVDPQGLMQYVSPNWTEMLGHPVEEIVGQSYTTVVHPDDVPQCQAFGELVMRSRSKQTGRPYRVQHRDGSWRWHLSNGAPPFDDQGRLVGMLAIARDITEQREAEHRILYMAQHDLLTDLPNRSLLFDRIDHALRLAERRSHRLALLFIDLDEFKPINDRHGHTVGDLALCEVARRMRNALRESDTVARTGGDEFIVLLPELDAAPSAMRVAHKLLEAITTPMRIQGLALHVSASIGVAVYPEDGTDTDTLVSAADGAMYRAKHAGGNAAALWSAGTEAG